MAVRLLGGSGTAFPVTDVAVIEHASAVVQKPVTTANPIAHEIDQVLSTLMTTSLEVVRDANRDPSWTRPPRAGARPADVAQALKQQYSNGLAADQETNPVAAAIAPLLACANRSTEDGTRDRLAASVASINWTNIAETSAHPYIAAVNATLALGDRGRHRSHCRL